MGLWGQWGPVEYARRRTERHGATWDPKDQTTRLTGEERGVGGFSDPPRRAQHTRRARRGRAGARAVGATVTGGGSQRTAEPYARVVRAEGVEGVWVVHLVVYKV